MKFWQQKLEELPKLSNFVIVCDDQAWVTILAKIYQKQLDNFQKAVILAPEVTTEWLSSNLQNLSLFSEKIKWNILNAEKIPVATIANLKIHEGDTLLWFWFFQKPKSVKWKELGATMIEIPKVARWEEKSCVLWLAKIWNVDVNFIQKYWPFDQELSLSQHVQLLEMVASGMITIENVQEYFSQITFEAEKFQMLDFLEKQDFKSFWPTLKLQLERSADIEALRLIQFCKNHLLKMANAKDNPAFSPKNNFEKKLAQSAKSWPKKNMLRLIKVFSEWEILAKAGKNLQYQVAEELC